MPSMIIAAPVKEWCESAHVPLTTSEQDLESRLT